MSKGYKMDNKSFFLKVWVTEAVIFTLGISLCFFAQAKSTVAYIEYTPGIDEGTDTLLPTSDWRLEISPTFSASCEDIAPGLTFLKTTSVNVTSYINRNLNCSTANHPGFEDETGLTWTDKGLKQMAGFGNETITCPVFGTCEMERVISTSDKHFGLIELENGENGTANGSAKVFVTKLGSLSVTSVPGVGGIGGKNDLSAVAPQTRYCAKITDALSVDATEETSKVPYAEINIYNWLPFSIVGGGVNGTNAQSGRRVEVYEGLSPTALHRLKKLYFE